MVGQHLTFNRSKTFFCLSSELLLQQNQSRMHRSCNCLQAIWGRI